MSMSIANQSSFPIFLQDGLSYNSHVDAGLTKRELFAAMAMQGLLASWGNHDVTDSGDLASDAVRAADALIAELSKPKENE